MWNFWSLFCPKPMSLVEAIDKVFLSGDNGNVTITYTADEANKLGLRAGDTSLFSLKETIKFAAENRSCNQVLVLPDLRYVLKAVGYKLDSTEQDMPPSQFILKVLNEDGVKDRIIREGEQGTTESQLNATIKQLELSCGQSNFAKSI